MLKISNHDLIQREIMAGLVNATLNENLLWNIERTVSNVFIPLLNTNCMGDKGSDQLLFKVKKELLPCLRSFTRYNVIANLLYLTIYFQVPCELLKWCGRKGSLSAIFHQKLIPSSVLRTHGHS